MVSDFIFYLRENLAYFRDVKTTNILVLAFKKISSTFYFCVVGQRFMLRKITNFSKNTLHHDWLSTENENCKHKNIKHKIGD